MSLKPTFSTFVIVGVSVAIAYLIVKGELTLPRFLLFAGVVIVASIFSSREDTFITIEEAKVLARDFLLRELFDKEHLIPADTKVFEAKMTFLTKITQKKIERNADKYSIVFDVEPSKKYVVTLDVFGTILGYEEVKIPGGFSLSDIKDEIFKVMGVSLEEEKPVKGEKKDV